VSDKIVIATRESPLALWQAEYVKARLEAEHPALHVTLLGMTSRGDQLLEQPLYKVGGKGLFVKELETALLDGRADIAVHSMKDMPVLQPEGLLLDCYLPREDVRDAFVSLEFDSLDALPAGTKVGSSSLRRRAQLTARRPDLEVVEFRGNVQTRMKKLEDGVAGATFLAQAGLNRLGMADVARSAISPEDMLPAVAQGAIGIERRANDPRTAEMLAAIHDRDTGIRLAAERAFLAGLDGSCETPIAGLAEIDGPMLRLRGEILRPDGSEVLSGDRSAPIAEAAKLGADMARDLRARAGEGFFDWITAKA